MATRRFESSFGWIAVVAAIGGLAWLAGDFQPEKRRAVSPHSETHTDHLSCGPAALLAVAAGHDADTASHVRAILETAGLATRPISSLYDLAACARQAGLDPIGLKVESQQLHRLPLPAIVHMKPGHFLALMDVRQDRVVVIDQGSVRREISRRVFVRRFSGYVLCFNSFDSSNGAGRSRQEE
ncbi:MAG: hypothetical protein KAY37_10465 [Phycisphaerae bacterium]|nr:hypothetical protein [Phycisphaerae bacterium]